MSGLPLVALVQSCPQAASGSSAGLPIAAGPGRYRGGPRIDVAAGGRCGRAGSAALPREAGARARLNMYALVSSVSHGHMIACSMITSYRIGSDRIVPCVGASCTCVGVCAYAHMQVMWLGLCLGECSAGGGEKGAISSPNIKRYGPNFTLADKVCTVQQISGPPVRQSQQISGPPSRRPRYLTLRNMERSLKNKQNG